MALPTIVFNNGTGSDTQASGAGPATAKFGTAATYAGSVFTLDGSPDLSGVLTDGSHVIWVATTTGTQWFKITAVNDGADTVTVTPAPAGTASGLTWGLGGKRKTIGATSSRLLFSTDIKPGWTVTLEDDQPALTSAVACTVAGDTTSGYITLQGDSTSSRRLLTSETNNTSMLSGGLAGWTIKNLKFTSTAGTKTTSYGVVFNATNAAFTRFKNCIFGDADNKLQSAIARTGTAQGGIVFESCEVTTCIGAGINGFSGGAGLTAQYLNCWIHDNGAGGIVPVFSGIGVACIIDHCLIETNTGIGVDLSGGASNQTMLYMTNTVIHANTSDGVKLVAATTPVLSVYNNQITANGGYGVNCSAGTATVNDTLVSLLDYNNFGTGALANTSGAVNGATNGANALALDPLYTDAANANFGIGATACRAGGYPDKDGVVGLNSLTVNNIDIGAAQHAEAAASGAAHLFQGSIIRAVQPT